MDSVDIMARLRLWGDGKFVCSCVKFSVMFVQSQICMDTGLGRIRQCDIQWVGRVSLVDRSCLFV